MYNKSIMAIMAGDHVELLLAECTITDTVNEVELIEL